MEEKKYEAGRVEISSAEYRDLVKDAIDAHHDAEEQLRKRWEVEDVLKKTKEELEITRKKVSELEKINEAFRRASQTPVYHDYAPSHSKLFDIDGNFANAKEDI